MDSPDLSLNISREMLQHDRQLKIIANNIEKKVKNELVKLHEGRPRPSTSSSGLPSACSSSMASCQLLRPEPRHASSDLLLFWSSKENKLTSLEEYVDRMPADSGDRSTTSAPSSVDHASKMPQAERVLDRPGTRSST